MPVAEIINAAESALLNLDWIAYQQWDIVGPILDTIVPDWLSGYQP